MHGKSEVVSRPGIAVLLVRKGTSLHVEDKDRLYLFFLLAVPDAKDHMETELLNKLNKMVKDQRIADSIISAKGKIEVLNIMEEAEQEKIVREGDLEDTQ